MSVDSNLTIRRMIITWVLDLYAVGTTGTINSKSPVTLGAVETRNDEDTFDPPPYGPHADPSYPWRWWDGAVFQNSYGFSTDTGEGGAMSAAGKIDRVAPFELLPIDGEWAAIWLSLEIQDAGEVWSSFAAQAWFSILTAPSVG